MRSREELIQLVKELLENKLDELWAELTPEERGTVFRNPPTIIDEFIDITY